MLELNAVRMELPADANIIVGQAHFIKTVEDMYEAIVSTAPQAKFGLAFNEASGACLTRADGNDEALQQVAIRNAQALACGHVFVLVLAVGYPINVLNAMRNLSEVCSIFCATRRGGWRATERRGRAGGRFLAARSPAQDRLQALDVERRSSKSQAETRSSA
jgi:adenosine/AMP kinase